MDVMNRAFPENSVIGVCVKLAHATFYDALPSNAAALRPTAPAVVDPPKRRPRESFLKRWTNAFDNWCYRQSLKEREAYLAQAQDVFDLENRMRRLEQRPLPYY
jgi:hypothetical protein